MAKHTAKMASKLYDGFRKRVGRSWREVSHDESEWVLFQLPRFHENRCTFRQRNLLSFSGHIANQRCNLVASRVVCD